MEVAAAEHKGGTIPTHYSLFSTHSLTKETERALRMKKMARQNQANDEFSLTSFLYGGNADYLEQLQAAYEDDPQSVDPEWQDFFAALKDDAIDVRKNAKGASWSKPSWPLQANGELVSALDGNWGLVEKVIEKKVRDKANGAAVNGAAVSDADIHQATRDSVRAIMMIR